MSNKNPLLSNLKPYSAPDLDETGVKLTVRVAPDDREWLKRQEGGMSYHTRRAIVLYRRLMSEAGTDVPIDIDSLKEALGTVGKREGSATGGSSDSNFKER